MDRDRELVKNRKRDARGGDFGFLKLPSDLQDRVVAALDGHEISMLDAARMCKAEGYEISYESIRRYYYVLQVERRREEYSIELQRCFQQICEMRPEMEKILHNKAIELFTCLSAGIMEAIKSGSIDQKAAAKMIEALTPYLMEGVKSGKDPKPVKGTVIDVPAETRRKLREEVYGI
jgi:hypothetical protein